jgi:hypothetical protein
MDNNNESIFSTISLKQETVEKLKTVKSCFQLGKKKSVTYDDIINLVLEKGLEITEPRISKILALAKESSEDESVAIPLSPIVPDPSPHYDEDMPEDIINPTHDE